MIQDSKLIGLRAVKEKDIYNRLKDTLSSGHFACPGCGAILGLRMALQVLAPRCIFVIPACCMAVADGPYPMSALGVPLYHCAFASTAPVAAGISRALRKIGDDKTIVVGWAGDGGTFDIGFSGLSAAASRNDDILYVCYDNEAYMNTGIQQSSATPEGAWTTTSPIHNPKKGSKKDVLTLLLAHRIPYMASVNPAFPEDFFTKFERAIQTKGFRFIHLFSACPPGHKSREADTIHISRLSVQTRVFPLYEVINGQVKITLDPPLRPVKDYISLQGRFKHWDEFYIKRFCQYLDEQWHWLKKLEEITDKVNNRELGIGT
ncbi:MAG: thiamine pyrophosphate-dependent enzyme [bacterium]